MSDSFAHGMINTEFEDPSLFVRVLREKRALLFDIGNITNLGPGDLQKITDVFVTHTHIDHFMGFDTLLRAVLRREVPLRVYGPANIIECVEGKLKGYTWNLIQDYPLTIQVFAVGEQTNRSCRFDAANSFSPTDESSTEFGGVVLREPLFTVKALVLDHQVPCLGFTLEEEFQINIDKDLLEKKGLEVGPWLTDFKKAIREGSEDKTYMVGGVLYHFKDLSAIARVTAGKKISYVTDVQMTERNIGGIIDFVRGSDVFYCEAYFMEKDRDRALERFHLTAKACGRIAREAGVKRLVPIHFSPRYRNRSESPREEAQEEFRKGAS
jgi:ribonuclease Z